MTIEISGYKVIRENYNNFICTNNHTGTTAFGRTAMEAIERAARQLFRKNSYNYLLFIRETLDNSDLRDLGF